MSGDPVRLRLSREKGFDLQAHSRAINGLPAINCARPAKWGNPFKVTATSSAENVVDAFARGITSRDADEIRQTLIGKNLACWCALDAPCHADVLLTIANRAFA